ncbi:hypothetical protein [Polyangium jinanense]|uniref:PEGA domain-containing protein n=1 Tax=Polyangium jinanense TaxID=2829994 RepID=A0A9X3WXH8_9BACT|nr:hypothetical protein [Polyangium jinanense]MDC3952293.1 hypothetical protein [Polyangium jinanense]MDC3956438.1 hypothetical protein [Polyangium jinanense]MDC3979922.1 hypothetical protein [Polyangium jinanense]MDC3982575.1 hypothetical protein [Polyangium jinanense]
MRSALTRTFSAITALAMLAAACPALAQGKGAGKKPPAEPAAPEDPKLVEAKKHMEAGAAFYNDPSGHKCEEAYREFKKAYELSGSMNAVKGMGLCAMELERDGEAISLLDKFLEAKGDQLDPADKQQMETDLKALRSVVAWVTLKSDRPGVTITDVRTPARGFPITNRYTIGLTDTRIGIHPGSHEFKASVDGAPDQIWKVDIPNGGKFEREFEFDKGKPVTAEGFTEKDFQSGGEDKPAEQPSRPVPMTVFIVGGAAIAAGIAGAVVGGVLATGAKADFDASNGKANTASELVVLEDMRSKVVTLNTVADVCFGLAAAGAVAATVLFVMRPEKKPTEPPKESFAFAPWATPQGGGMMAVGTF